MRSRKAKKKGPDGTRSRVVVRTGQRGRGEWRVRVADGTHARFPLAPRRKSFFSFLFFFSVFFGLSPLVFDECLRHNTPLTTVDRGFFFMLRPSTSRMAVLVLRLRNITSIRVLRRSYSRGDPPSFAGTSVTRGVVESRRGRRRGLTRARELWGCFPRG